MTCVLSMYNLIRTLEALDEDKQHAVFMAAIKMDPDGEYEEFYTRCIKVCLYDLVVYAYGVPENKPPLGMAIRKWLEEARKYVGYVQRSYPNLLKPEGEPNQ